MVVVPPFPQVTKLTHRGIHPAEAGLARYFFCHLKKTSKNMRFMKENSCTGCAVMLLKDCVLVEARQI
jgi:hypothetical protein